MTSSMLFAGLENHNYGEHKCFYCGAPCDEQYKTKDYVKPTFTNRDIVKQPGSEYVCRGCVESMGPGDDEIKFIDGTTKKRTNSRGMQPRMYSWILYKDKKYAGTKAHIKQWRNILLNPPDAPFSIVLADSCQKQLIFRAPVAIDKARFFILLEDEEIEVCPEILKNRIDMCTPICAALGKPALLGEITFSSYTRYNEYHGEIESLEKWLEVKSQPLSRLAAWLSKSKEDTKNEYPNIECGKISPVISGSSRQKQNTSRHGVGSDKGGSGQVLLDLS